MQASPTKRPQPLQLKQAVTLAARLSFTDAAPPDVAEPLYEAFCGELVELGIRVERGVFRARMAVELVNDGPVTIVLDI